MGGFGEGSAENNNSVSKDANNTAGSSENKGSGTLNGGVGEGQAVISDHTEHSAAIGQKATVSPITWLNETFSGVGKQVAERVRSEIVSRVSDKLPLMLEAAAALPPGDKKSFDILVTPETEAKRKLSKAPPDVQDSYIKFRKAQMNHEHVGVDAIKDLKQNGDLRGAQEYRDNYARTMAWLSFPEQDHECNDGRNVTDEYIKRVLDREDRTPTADELTKDNKLLSQIYSLQLNDHDYLHNENEITRRNGMNHLPEKFMGIGADGQPKEFKLRELAQSHIFAILEGNRALTDRRVNPTYKSPLAPDDRANLAFYSQVLRQVLPADLLLADDVHTGQRNAVLSEYVPLYKARDVNCTVGRAKWQTLMNTAIAEYPNMSKIMPGANLNQAEKIYEHLTLADLRQLRIEQQEMASLEQGAAGGRGGGGAAGVGAVARAAAAARQQQPPPPQPDVQRTGQRKDSELAEPDQERLAEFGKIKPALREYREGQTLFGRSAMQSVFEFDLKEYAKLNISKKNRLAGWDANPNHWQRVYVGEIPELSDQHNQVEAWQRWPASPWCGFSRQGAEYLMQVRDINFRKQPQAEQQKIIKGIFQLQTKLVPEGAPAAAPECQHQVMPRRKDKIQG